MRLKILKEIQKRFDPVTGEALEEKTLNWIVDEKTNRKIALMCLDEEHLAPLLASAPELFEYVEDSIRSFNQEVAFKGFDTGIKLVQKAKGE